MLYERTYGIKCVSCAVCRVNKRTMFMLCLFLFAYHTYFIRHIVRYTMRIELRPATKERFEEK